MSPPSLTVIIPVRNGAAWVADAVRSVLAQSPTPTSLVVVDDGSTDETLDVLERFGGSLVVIRQRPRGLSSARNAGIRESTSDLLVFLDADDLQPAGYLDAFVAAAIAHPNADVFHCGWRAVDLDDRVLYATDEGLPLDADPFHALLATGSPHIGAMCVRRRAVDRAGLFDETLMMQEDWDFWLRLARSGATFHAVSGPAFVVRRRPSSMSGVAGSALALTGLSVVERQFALHRPCPLCADTRRLDEWRLAALRASAGDMTRRVPLPGRLGRWVGTALAIIGRPRLAPAAFRQRRAARG